MDKKKEQSFLGGPDCSNLPNMAKFSYRCDSIIHHQQTSMHGSDGSVEVVR